MVQIPLTTQLIYDNIMNVIYEDAAEKQVGKNGTGQAAAWRAERVLRIGSGRR